MISTTFKVTLDIHDIYSQFRLRIKKGDTSGRLLVTLTQLGKPYHITEDCYAVLAGVKEDGSILHNKCEIEDDVIIYHFTEKTTSTAGIIPCDIIIYDSNGTELVSPHFTMEVYDSVYSEEEVESSNEFNSLNKLIVAANNLVNNVTEKLNNGEFVGEQGIQGEQGPKGEATEMYAQETPNFDKPAGTIWLETATGNVYQHEGGYSVALKGNIRGPQGERGIQGERGPAGVIKFISVASLPTENIETGAIYLVPVADSTEEENRFTEYVYIDGKWEVIGAISIQVDHSEYVKFTDYASKEKAGVVKVNNQTNGKGIAIDTNGEIGIYQALPSNITGKNNEYRPITPKNMDLAWKVSATTNTEEWTDEEKASACETIGAVKRATTTSGWLLYGREGATEKTFSSISSANNGKITNGVIPRYQHSSNATEMDPVSVLLTGTPLHSYHATTKKYVDNLPDNLTLTDEQKAKWLEWLGASSVTPTYVHNIKIDVGALATAYITIMNKNASEFTKATLINTLQGGVVQASGVYLNQGHIVGVEATSLRELVVYVAPKEASIASPSQFAVDTLQNTITVTDRVVTI